MLIVDDDPINCIAVEGLVDTFKLKSVVCSDGDEALSAFQKKFFSKCCLNKFDIVFTDLQMPNIDGFRLT